MNNSWNQSDYNKKFLQASNIRSGFDRAFADKSGWVRLSWCWTGTS